MSRIGRRSIAIPAGVSVTLADGVVNVRGPKGTLSQPLVDGVGISVEGAQLVVTRDGDEREQRARHGLMRALLANMVHGTSVGFSRTLEIIGIGYKAEAKGRNVVFTLGYSHPIEFTPPAGVSVAVEKGVKVVVSGIDRVAVGQVAATIRGFRPPDSYKGKGVRYERERVRIKPGKSAKK